MFKSIKWNLVVIMSIIIIAICISPVVFQNDTFYTIQVGERIVNEGFVQLDSFTRS